MQTFRIMNIAKDIHSCEKSFYKQNKWKKATLNRVKKDEKS